MKKQADKAAIMIILAGCVAFGERLSELLVPGVFQDRHNNPGSFE
ncbi:hypothetical protein P6U16_08710 [Rhizobium sp. 32-5/1]|nr:hypothetical protein [Rhizobium sp. 32-5/1]WEZ84636.1 hypothetical protein P6U16_08710 [Rhizobium sp. 32-5/1]